MAKTLRGTYADRVMVTTAVYPAQVSDEIQLWRALVSIVQLLHSIFSLLYTENNSYQGFLAFYQKSKSAMAMKSVQFGFVGMNMVSKVALNRRLSHFVSVLYEHAVATLILVKGNARTVGFILKLARPLLYLMSQQKGPIILGCKLGKCRGRIALLLMMNIAIASNVAAVTIDNTETISSTGEAIPVGDKLPPSCHYVAKCGDCFPCTPKGHGFCCGES